MNANPDPDREDGLLDAVLRDEAWLAASHDLKVSALRAFRTRQTVRRATRLASVASVLAVVAISGVRWLQQPAAAPSLSSAKTAPIPAPAKTPNPMSDEELVSSFPPGTCFLAEVDGKKTLTFLDPKIQSQYLASPGRPLK